MYKCEYCDELYQTNDSGKCADCGCKVVKIARNDISGTTEFNNLLNLLENKSLLTLQEKNAKYSQNGDALHNFKAGAMIAGTTPAKTCWGYLTKHLTALRDMVERNDFSDTKDFLEKCQDSINYIRFLWCIGNEEVNKNKEK